MHMLVASQLKMGGDPSSILTAVDDHFFLLILEDNAIRSITYLQYTVHIFRGISTVSFSSLLLLIIILQSVHSPLTQLFIPLLCVFQSRPKNYKVAHLYYLQTTILVGKILIYNHCDLNPTHK